MPLTEKPGNLSPQFSRVNTLIQLEPPYAPKKTGKISIFIEDLSRNSVCYFEMRNC